MKINARTQIWSSQPSEIPVTVRRISGGQFGEHKIVAVYGRFTASNDIKKEKGNLMMKQKCIYIVVCVAGFSDVLALLMASPQQTRQCHPAGAPAEKS